MTEALTIRRGDYAERIRNLWRAHVEAIFATGRELIEAKGALEHGEFEAMVEGDLPFGTSTARMLMIVAKHPLLSKRQHVDVLPPSWGTLYALSRVPEPILESALVDGRITPDMERKAVAALLPTEERPRVLSPTATVHELKRLISLGRKFGTIYADPPWAYGNQATRAATDNHYPTMTVEEIAALPVSELVADDAHLHLWTTNAFGFEARRIMEAWGFEYKSCFVWVKPQMGIGNYWRVSHEFLLFGLRGKAPFADRGLMSWASLDRTEHSEKPGEIRLMVECASPAPRLELFGREVAEGWTVWGNEIEHGLFDPNPEEIAL